MADYESEGILGGNFVFIIFLILILLISGDVGYYEK